MCLQCIEALRHGRVGGIPREQLGFHFRPLLRVTRARGLNNNRIWGGGGGVIVGILKYFGRSKGS